MKLNKRKIVSLIPRLILFPLRGKNILLRIFNVVASLIEEFSDSYITYRLYPKAIKNENNSCIATRNDASELGVVIQGIIEEKDDFTLNTVKFYQYLFPGAKIIISTWNYTKSEMIQKFQNIGCEIVLSENFKPSGLGNVNYQICTSLAGVKRAQSLGCKYTIKCRSDLRIYKPYAFDYLKNILQLFPCKCDTLSGRIVSFSAGSGQLFYPYWIQDYFYFGYTSDLVSLFDIPYDLRNVSSGEKYLREKYSRCTGYDMCAEEVPEVYITKRFLEKHVKMDGTLANSWECVNRFFVVIDFDDLSAIWHKYNRQCENDFLCEFTPEGYCPDNGRNINFSNWLMLYNHSIEYNKAMENERRQKVLFN